MSVIGSVNNKGIGITAEYPMHATVLGLGLGLRLGLVTVPKSYFLIKVYLSAFSHSLLWHHHHMPIEIRPIKRFTCDVIQAESELPSFEIIANKKAKYPLFF